MTQKEIRRQIIEIVYEEAYHSNLSDKTNKLEALFAKAQVEAVGAARIDELKEIQLSDSLNDDTKDILYQAYIVDRLASLTKDKEK